MAEYINKNRPVYFSYARNEPNSNEYAHIADVVDILLDILKKENIQYSLDREDSKPGGIVTDYEKEIGEKSECVILVFSEKYFKSMHCMYELVQIKKNYKGKKFLCIKSGQFKLDTNYISQLEQHWRKKKSEYEYNKEHHFDTTPIEDAAYANDFYIKEINSLRSFFSNIAYSNSDNKDWSSFILEIKRFYTKKTNHNNHHIYLPIAITLGIIGIVISILLHYRNNDNIPQKQDSIIGNTNETETSLSDEQTLSKATSFQGWIESINSQNYVIRNVDGQTLTVTIPNPGEELIEGEPIIIKYIATDGANKAATEVDLSLAVNFKKLLGKWGTANNEITFELRKSGKCNNNGYNENIKSWRMKDNNTIEFEVANGESSFFMPWGVENLSDNTMTLTAGENSKLEMTRIDSNRE